MSRAVDAHGNPTGAKDERGILLDLTAHDVEAMSQRDPGSASRYLQERRKQLEALKEKQRLLDDRERFEEAFVKTGGSKGDAAAAYKADRNRRAAEAARRADQEAVDLARRSIRSRV